WSQIAFAEEKFPDSETAARECAALSTSSNQVDQAALCEAFLARALLAQRKTAEAREEVAKGSALLAKSKTAIAKGILAVVTARVKAAEAPGDPAAIDALHAALQQATACGVVSDQWEARLALAELEPADSPAIV